MTTHISRRALLSTSRFALAGLVLGSAQAVAQSPATRRRSLARLIANENPYGPSPAARSAATRAVPEGWKYAIRQAGELKKLIAGREGVSTSNVMIGAGSGEVLRIAALVYGLAGGEVIAARPTFTFLTDYARQIGCEIVEVGLTDAMLHDLDAMAERVTAETRLVYVCNPNNPTGTRVAGPEVRAFVETVSNDAPVLVDEAYLDLFDPAYEHSAVPRVLAGDAVIVTRTFSKLHGMAGMRIGYAIAPPDIIKRFESLRMSMLNLPGLLAATASYTDSEFQAFSRDKIATGLKLTTDWLDAAGIAYASSYGNFIYFDTGGSVSAFSKAMRERGIITGRSYAPYKSWTRVSVGTVENMEQFVAAAREYFAT